MAHLTRQIVIVHLSDLHFGANHRFNPPATPAGDPGKRTGFPTLADKLLADLAEPRFACPVLICITGDLVEKATFEEYREAEEFLRRLVTAEVFGCRMSRDSIFLVPGNHDVRYLSGDLGERWQPWVELYNRINDSSLRREEILDAVRLHHMPQAGALVLTINSAMYVQKGTADEERGHVDFEQLERIERLLKDFPLEERENCIRVALIHHHPILMPPLTEAGRGCDAVVNSGTLISILRRHGFHLILHGHKHDPRVFSEDDESAYVHRRRRPALLLAGGSIGSTELPDAAGRTNTYNRIIVKWHPAADQARILVDTRGLQMSAEDGDRLLPSQWFWESLRVEDRSFFGSKRLPPPCGGQHLSPFESAGLTQEEDRRVAEYARLRGNMLVIEVLPSLKPEQAYSARLWVTPHWQMREAPVSVAWQAGRNFSVASITFEEDPNFCVEFSYWDSMLVQANLRFADGVTERAYIYARIPTSYETSQKEGLNFA